MKNEMENNELTNNKLRPISVITKKQGIKNYPELLNQRSTLKPYLSKTNLMSSNNSSYVRVNSSLPKKKDSSKQSKNMNIKIINNINNISTVNYNNSNNNVNNSSSCNQQSIPNIQRNMSQTSNNFNKKAQNFPIFYPNNDFEKLYEECMQLKVQSNNYTRQIQELKSELVKKEIEITKNNKLYNKLIKSSDLGSLLNSGTLNEYNNQSVNKTSLKLSEPSIGKYSQGQFKDYIKEKISSSVFKNSNTHNFNNNNLNNDLNMNCINSLKENQLVYKLKQQFSETKNEVKEKEEKLDSIKKSLKFTKLNELLNENKIIKSEFIKLKDILKEEISLKEILKNENKNLKDKIIEITNEILKLSDENKKKDSEIDALKIKSEQPKDIKYNQKLNSNSNPINVNSKESHVDINKKDELIVNTNFDSFIIDIINSIYKNIEVNTLINKFKSEQVEKIKHLLNENETEDKSSYTKSNTVNSNSLSKNKQKTNNNKNTFNKKLSSTLKPMNNLAPLQIGKQSLYKMDLKSIIEKIQTYMSNILNLSDKGIKDIKVFIDKLIDKNVEIYKENNVNNNQKIILSDISTTQKNLVNAKIVKPKKRKRIPRIMFYAKTDFANEALWKKQVEYFILNENIVSQIDKKSVNNEKKEEESKEKGKHKSMNEDEVNEFTYILIKNLEVLGLCSEQLEEVS